MPDDGCTRGDVPDPLRLDCRECGTGPHLFGQYLAPLHGRAVMLERRRVAAPQDGDWALVELKPAALYVEPWTPEHPPDEIVFRAHFATCRALRSVRDVDPEEMAAHLDAFKARLCFEDGATATTPELLAVWPGDVMGKGLPGFVVEWLRGQGARRKLHGGWEGVRVVDSSPEGA